MDSAASVEEMSIAEETIKPLISNASQSFCQLGTFSDSEYFTSYEDLEIHRLMVGDVPRTTAYRQAILGNEHLFKGKIIMDVGAGTGILSLFAAAAGAAKVYAVEASSTAEIVKKVAADNGYGDVISVIHSRVEDVQLPEGEKVDVIISEWMGFYLVHESMLQSVLNARDKFLSEDGMMFPSEARLYASACKLDSLYDEQLNFWNSVHGFNMTAVRSAVLQSKGKKPEVCIVKPEELLSKPVCFKTFNLRWMDVDEVDNFSEDMFVDIIKPGSYHGVCVWFECDFDGREYNTEGEEYGKLVTLSTSPWSEPTHWKQTVVTFGDCGTSKNTTEETENSEINSETARLQEGNINSTNNNSKLKNQSPIEPNNTDLKNSLNSADKPESIPSDEFYQLEVDEVIGWKFSFASSGNTGRHYNISLEQLDPETTEHPESCGCSLPRCLIIAKLLEQELLQCASSGATVREMLQC